jgi:hypothetical protein
MRRINILLVFLLVICAINAQDSQSKKGSLATFGSEIDAQGALAVEEMTAKYQNLAIADTLKTKFAATVTDVCKAKGCWMKLQMKDGSEAMVKFKDYGFFMPKDIEGRKVVVNGKAFVSEMSVEDQRHYAKDAGKTEEEIIQITKPKKIYGFEADGVLLEQ